MHPSITDAGPIHSGAALDRVVSFLDHFSDDLARGRVVGSSTGDGIHRKGADRERIISIDHGALRIEPLVRPGWGKAGIAYGPYPRRNGLAFSASLINGHNISRTQPLPDSFPMRLWRWLVGSETENPLTRMRYWVPSGQRKFMWRRLMQWVTSGTRFFRVPTIDENLSVGWFSSEAPADPLQQGNALIVHAVVPEGGELWARTEPAILRALRGLQNVPMYYLVVLRERGAAYYAASIPGVAGIQAYPSMQILAIDAFNTDEQVYAGIHQSVLGEIGFRVDTRVYRAQVAALPEFCNWYGSAHGADMLTGEGSLHLSGAEVGGAWQTHGGELRRTERGTVGTSVSNAAMLALQAPAGLVHVLIEATDQPVAGVGVIWRAQDEENYWCFEVGSRGCQLSLREGGRWCRFPAVKDPRVAPNTTNSLQVADDGECIRLYLNGDLVYGTAFSDARLQHAAGVGIQIVGTEGNAWLRSFEAHPRGMPIPRALTLNEPPVLGGTRTIVEDDFAGAPMDLAGHITPVGGQIWRRDIGSGEIQLTGKGAVRVAASAQRPCPGRTAYTIDWVNRDFADVEVTITPPGTRKKMKEKGRAGLIFWQDPHNYVILSAFVEDWPAMSIAAFFQWNGFEELFDAVWSNVGNRMQWGVPHDFRVVFDGNRFLASINREPVLYRALTDVYPNWSEFLIHRVGIVANWEWGNDTGSRFERFVVRDRA